MCQDVDIECRVEQGANLQRKENCEKKRASSGELAEEGTVGAPPPSPRRHQLWLGEP